MIGLIWAQAQGGVIGAGGVMPWHLPEDLAHFKRVTLGSPVVMGRRTWESIPERFRPLRGRRNIVVTRQESWAGSAEAAGAERAGSVEEALALAQAGEHGASESLETSVWIMGGGDLYRQTLALADRLEVTELDLAVDGDTHAPDIDGTWRLVAADPADGWHTSAGGIRHRFLSYAR
ncbi:dihydrofolate reductase [Agromyces protaetiae]|uniref:Dihydrofolate reductase n=1 Tax=Agromyces protaetiae TaxID=2509455 RepID=A0A4P6FUT1_9MICO|nr:dihydrofolate reductase [Agromyces protaetiae]QAY74328.1 dihydrofolate reductase [Agromyces protaetiae]